MFTDGRITWKRPVTLRDMLVLKQEHPEAPIIMGNLTTGRLNLLIDRPMAFGN